jgi:hypothetical protein
MVGLYKSSNSQKNSTEVNIEKWAQRMEAAKEQYEQALNAFHGKPDAVNQRRLEDAQKRLDYLSGICVRHDRVLK